MAYVQGSLGEKISKTMDDAAALFKQGDYQQSIDMFARAWDCSLTANILMMRAT